MIFRFLLLMVTVCPGLVWAAADPQTLAMGSLVEDPEKPSPSPGLEVFIEGKASYRLGGPVMIRFELRNHTPEPIEVLKWGTPLEGKFLRDMFTVELGPHATPVPYKGRSVKPRYAQGKRLRHPGAKICSERPDRPGKGVCTRWTRYPFRPLSALGHSL